MAEMDLFILVLHTSTYFAFIHRRWNKQKSQIHESSCVFL